MTNNNNPETATLANGCFWCTEAIFKRVKGVSSVLPGYSGGIAENPNYYQLHSGETGHAEAIEIKFDPKIVSFDKLLDVFFATHDPTTLNRQGNDMGAQYRSAIFYHDEDQLKTAEGKIKELDKSGRYEDKIVTQVVPYTKFYEAEDYHKNFYESGNRPDYCRYIIDPKIQKLLTNFKEDVKEEYK